MLNQQWGLIVWTLITFGIALFVLWRFAFGPIQKIIDERRAHISESIETADETRVEAARLLAEYRETLGSVRAEAEEILERSRKAGDTTKAEIVEEARRQAQRTVEKAQEQLERDVRVALQQLKGEIAGLTLLATEQVVGQVARRRRSPAPDRRGVASRQSRRPRAGERPVSDTGIARVYATALFEAATAADTVERTRRRLARLRPGSRRIAAIGQRRLQPADRARGQGAGAGAAHQRRRPPGRGRARRACSRRVVSRSPARSPTSTSDFVAQAARVVEIEVTTAVPVEPDVERLIMERVRRSTGGEPRLTKRVDPDILGRARAARRRPPGRRQPARRASSSSTTH